MNIDILTYKLLIKGKVQDVGYRYWFNKIAISMNINGYVKNLINKDEVEVLIQGQSKNIFNIIEKSKIGPEFAIVISVISKKTLSNKIYKTFSINN